MIPRDSQPSAHRGAIRLQSLLNAESTIAAPPAASEFPGARQLRSRDVFRLVARAWPFIRPYRRHLVYLFLATIPLLLGGLLALDLTRVFFDVVGHGNAPDAHAGVDAARAAGCGPADRSDSRVRRRRDRVGCRPDRRRIHARLRGVDFTAHQQSLPRQSLHPDAGTERALSFRGEDRRRDFPDVPGLRRDSECDQRLDRSAADFHSRRHGLDPLPGRVRLPDGADRRSADACEPHTGVDVRRFDAQRFHP